MEEEILHENDNYYVVTSDVCIEKDGTVYDCCYAVVNAVTGGVEHYTPVLPIAIHTAEDYNQAMVTKAWEWRNAQSASIN